MLDWTTSEWLVVGLAFLAGLFIGMFLLAGGKWKRRYREEVERRKEIERDRDNWSTRANASSERIQQLERANLEATQALTAHRAAPVAGGAAAGVAAGATTAAVTKKRGPGTGGGIIDRVTGRDKQDDFSRIRGIGPNGQERLHELGIRRYKDLEGLDERRIAEIEGSLGLAPGHFQREGWTEQARLLREGKDDEHSRLYPQRAV